MEIQLFTKQQIAEIALRPIDSMLNEQIKANMIAQLTHLKTSRFIREMRKATKLDVCIFAPNKFYFKN